VLLQIALLVKLQSSFALLLELVFPNTQLPTVVVQAANRVKSTPSPANSYGSSGITLPTTAPVPPIQASSIGKTNLPVVTTRTVVLSRIR
jgi:hypothetical protein